MQELVIMDYSDSSIHFYQISSNKTIDEDFIEGLGFHSSNCSWMFGDFISIKRHKHIL